MRRLLLPLPSRFAACILALACLQSPAVGGNRIAVNTQWLSVPVEELHRLVGEADLSQPGATLTISREGAEELIAATRKSPSGEAMKLRSVRLGIGEHVTFDPYHVPEDPSHRWSGFSTDDVFVGVERAEDVDGRIALTGKIGLMNRPQTRVITEPVALPADAAFVLRGFASTRENDNPFVQLLLAQVGDADEPSPRPDDQQFPYRIKHRDGIYIRGDCASLAEVIQLTGEAPKNAIAEGARRPPRISLDTPNWEIEVTKQCDDADLEQIARASRLWLLRLDGCPVTDAGLASLALQTGLTRLEITPNGRLGDDWVAALAEMKRLDSLRVQRADWNFRAAEVIANLPELSWLELAHCSLSGDAASALRDAPKLRSVSFAHSTLGTAGLRSLGEFPHLEVLDLSSVRVDSMPEPRPLANGDIASLKTSPQLSHLRIQSTRVSVTGLLPLGDTPRLFVDHRHSRVSDIDAQRLADRFGWTFHGACSCGCLDIEPSR